MLVPELDVLDPLTATAPELCLTGFISRSSWELVEVLELETGEFAEHPSVRNLSIGAGLKEPLLDDRLARPESTNTLSTSFPFTELVLLGST